MINLQDPIRQGQFRLAIMALAAAGCLLLSFLVYWPVLDDYFVWDDFTYLNEVRDYSFWEVIGRALTFPDGRRYWRPVTFIYFQLAEPAGLHPQPYHAVNIVLHGAAGALGMVFIARFARSLAAGVITGLVFVVAPTYDFTVIWLSDISELIAMCCLLSALTAFHAYLTATSRTAVYAIATVVFTVVGLASKESTAVLVVLLPALALALERDERRRSPKEIARVLLWPVVLGTVFAVVMQVRERLEPGGIYHGTGWQSVDNFWRFLTWIIFPYWYGEAMVLRDIGAGLLLALGPGLVVLRQRKHAFLVFWTLVAIVPFTGFGEFLELRHTYLPTLPFVAFLSYAAVFAVMALPAARGARVVAATGLGLLVAVVLVVAPMRTRDQQQYFSREAGNYELMVSSIRDLCGAMPPDSFVFVADHPYRDIFGAFHTRAALDVFYDGLYVGASRARLVRSPTVELPPAAGLFDERCVIRYDPRRQDYIRIE